MNDIQPYPWENGKEWAIITNQFGTFLSYNVPSLNEEYCIEIYQSDITKLIISRNYDIFVDVGAYIGYFTIIASHYCRKVMTYEASPLHYGVLLYNTRFMKNVECKYCFISNKESIPKIYDLTRKGLPCSNMINIHQLDEYNIPVRMLDQELLPYKDQRILIKMDIEGHELNAMKGALEIAKQPNIHWYIDIHKPHVKDEEIHAFFPNREIRGSFIGGVLK